MHMKVSTKLWFAFAGTLAVSLLSLYLLLQNSLKQGFLDYTSQQSIQRLEILRTALGKIYQDEQSFDQLRNDPERWINLKDIIFAESDSLFPEIPNTPATPTDTPQAYYREFVSSISLHNQEKDLILGIIKPQKTLEWIPIIINNKPVGFISFVKPTVVSRVQDQSFLHHQFKIFTLFSLLVLFIATLLAALFSKRISRPITELMNNMKGLAAGDYSRKMPILSHDEIGQLCISFNQLSQTLAANEQSRVNWIADISHEMRTPLAVLKVQIEAMQDGLRPADHKNLTLAYDKVLGLSQLIDDLFELTLSDLGTLTYQKENIAIKPLLEHCIESHQLHAKANGLTLSSDFHMSESAIVMADERRLEQLFCNLLENALRYTDSGGAIAVKLSVDDTNASIHIDDSAPNVPTDQHEKIFDRLYRVEGSRSRSTGGTGLGLAICKNIVTAHQGTIAASHSPLGGLRVTIQLPLSAQ